MSVEERMEAALSRFRERNPGRRVYTAELEAVEPIDVDMDGTWDENTQTHAGNEAGIKLIYGWEDGKRTWGRTEFEFENDSVDEIVAKLEQLTA